MHMAGTKRKRYANSIRSERAIIEAFLEEAKTGKRVERISVSSIVKRADINRGTFYNHFKSVEDVVKFIERHTLKTLYSFWDGCKNEEDAISVFFRRLAIQLKEQSKTVPPGSLDISSWVYRDVEYLSKDLVNYVFADIIHDKRTKIRLYTGMIGIAVQFLDYFCGHCEWNIEETVEAAVELFHYVIATSKSRI